MALSVLRIESFATPPAQAALFPAGHVHPASCSSYLAATLSLHIISAHLTPSGFNFFGIPSYDIRLAQRSQVCLDPVALHIWHLLRDPQATNIPADPSSLFVKSGLDYCRMLARTLIFMATCQVISLSEDPESSGAALIGRGLQVFG